MAMASMPSTQSTVIGDSLCADGVWMYEHCMIAESRKSNYVKMKGNMVLPGIAETTKVRHTIGERIVIFGSQTELFRRIPSGGRISPP